MARQVLPIIGAAAGFVISGGNPMGAQAGFAIGSLIGNAVDPIEVQGNKIGDNPLQTASEGGARAIVFGKGCIRSTCVLERGNRIIRKQRDQAGKGGGPVTISERVFWTFAIGLGEDLVGGAILRIWEGEKLVYDVTPGSTIPAESAEFADKFRFYDGAEDQLPDPDLESIHGVGNAPYYRGTAYVVFPNFDLTDYREAIPTYRWEVASAAQSEGGTTGWNPDETAAGAIFTDSNHTATIPSGERRGAQADSFRGPDGAWYAEVVIEAIGDSTGGSDVGIAPGEFDGLAEVGATIGGGASMLFSGQKYRAGVATDYFDELPVPGDVIRIALKDGAVWFALNGDWGGSGGPTTGGEPAFTGIDEAMAIAFSSGSTGNPSVAVRTKADEFSYPIPTGFSAWFDSGYVAGDPVPLSSIVAKVHRRCGHTASDYDVSELDDDVGGVVLEQSATGAEAINSIIGGYFADPSDYDAKLHYIKRGKAVQRTLTYGDLIDEPETTRRENAIEYPRKLHLFVQTSWTAYAATKSTSSRSSPDLNSVVGEVSVAIPVTFDGPDEPAQIAAKLHKVNWTDAEGEIVWQVTDEHADLVPTDCVGLSLRGRLTRARITAIEDSPGIRKLIMRVDRQSAYTSEVTGIPLPLPTPPQPSILAPTINAYMDIPALRDGDDGAAPVYYDAMTGSTDVWTGAVLQRSLDDGASWANATVTTLNGIMGLLLEDVAAASPYYTDNANAVVVQLFMDDTIDGLTDQQFLSEHGAFALSWEDSGTRRWEVMQFRDAEEIADKTYRLTTLHRGRLNTEAAAHGEGALFVLLDSAVRVVEAQSAWIGTHLTHRAVTNGMSPETATQETEPYSAQSQTEWPVAHVLLDHDGNNLHVEVVPRHRFGTALNPIRSINWTGYRIQATDGTNTAAADTTSDTHTLDVTGWASPITVTVAQLNRITGAGPTVTEAIA